ncbi:hypothetical protein OAF83_03260 [Rubripirellula sp.]|jgi:hypothetical protein|nr:hypothetical protein [Rubripirellula sp.]MDB4749905.1 hypothetical protein [Rubripirellula sp.]
MERKWGIEGSGVSETVGGDSKAVVLERFGLERLEDLSIREAGSLIDDLKRSLVGAGA